MCLEPTFSAVSGLVVYQEIDLMPKGVFIPLDAAFDRCIVHQAKGGPDPLLIKGAKTPNQEIARLLTAVAWGHLNLFAASNMLAARIAEAIAFLIKQQKYGIQCTTDRPRLKRWRDERFTPSHHYQWSKWIWGTIAFLLRRGLISVGQYAELYALLSWWVNSQAAVWNLVDPKRTGTILMAGARCGDESVSHPSGIDFDGPRKVYNEMRDFEWRAILKQRGEWPARNRETAINLALDAGFVPNIDAPLPIVSEPLHIHHMEYEGHIVVVTGFPLGPPGQGGAQFVARHSTLADDAFVMDEQAWVKMTGGDFMTIAQPVFVNGGIDFKFEGGTVVGHWVTPSATVVPAP